ncbi:MAG: DMT family transporter [Eubacteriales bacterium]|nr:DMT family transporter [Eubacteriales bacterium]
MKAITKTKAIVYIMIAASLWGMISIFNRILTSSGYGQLEIVFIRAFAALVGTFVFALFTDKNIFKVKLRDVWCFVGTGIISLVLFNICYFNAMQENISVAAVLLYTAPAFVIIFSAILFKEKITIKKLMSLVLMLVGCCYVTGIVSGASVSISTRCLFFGIASGIGYALYSIFGRYAINRGYSSETITLYTFVLATIGCLPIVNIADIAMRFDAFDIVGVLGIGILCSLLPYLLYTKGLAGVNNGQASVIATVEPVVATIISIAFGDSFGWNSALGMVLVIGSIIIINLNETKISNRRQ